MLTRLDHIVLLTTDLNAGKLDYETLLGGPAALTAKGEHYDTALFKTGNMNLELMSPRSESAARRTAEILGDRKSALTSLAFASKDIDEAHHLLTRRGALPSAKNNKGNFRLNDDVCAGIKTFILTSQNQDKDKDQESDKERAAQLSCLPRGLCLDHLVINTPNPNRAIAHYGARLGIRFALDRTHKDWGARFMFFKLDGIVLEVIHRLDANHNPEDSDEIWGLTWKVNNLSDTHDRLKDNGVTVSKTKPGRKPGTQVFTAKSHSAGIPTLFIEQTVK